MSVPAPAPHTEDVQPGRRPPRPLRLDRRRRRLVLQPRRASALSLVAVVAVSGIFVTRGGMPFSGAGSAEDQVEVQGAGVAVQGEPCRAEPSGAEIASGPVGGAAFGASGLGCAIPVWQALPLITLEATDAQMLFSQVTREQAVDPIDYRPDDLVSMGGGPYQARAEVAEQLDALVATAAEAGHPSLTVTSGFRSYETQAGTFADWAGRLGEERADILSARPGHSEHQLGLAVDLGGPVTISASATPRRDSGSPRTPTAGVSSSATRRAARP
ncbi:M15 family metallopeptidase [Ornithinimicrobium pratense]|uniref:M15 family metallopeptidase n=1 Tax=Ornithinimicrobium pratense TaxID=2593973 RepID=A0A5J6V763_9MICO|nr:M15 family metallopeptidase [Ornithinimicrobium pratense]